MKKTLTSILVVLTLGLALSSVSAQEEYDLTQDRIVPSPYLDVDVWVDRGDGSVYNPGDEISVFFETSRDCYVVVYNIDTRGYVNILYPYDETDSPWVERDEVYRIPGRYDDYDLRVDGPEGIEYVHAIASLEPIVLPDWPRYVGGMRGDHVDITVLRMEDEDPYDFIETIDYHIVRGDEYATDLCIFNVEYPHPRWYYHPRVYWVERPWHYPIGGVYIGCHFGAEVYIDGVFYGYCPITIPALICGRHFVTVYYFGCRVWWNWVDVYPDRTIRIRADFSHRYKFAHDGVIKKTYRIRKEKRLLSGGKTIIQKDKGVRVTQKEKLKVGRGEDYARKNEIRLQEKSGKQYQETKRETRVDKVKKVTPDNKKRENLKATKKAQQKDSSTQVRKTQTKKADKSTVKKAKADRKPARTGRSSVKKTSTRKRR